MKVLPPPPISALGVRWTCRAPAQAVSLLACVIIAVLCVMLRVSVDAARDARGGTHVSERAKLVSEGCAVPAPPHRHRGDETEARSSERMRTATVRPGPSDTHTHTHIHRGPNRTSLPGQTECCLAILWCKTRFSRTRQSQSLLCVFTSWYKWVLTTPKVSKCQWRGSARLNFYTCGAPIDRSVAQMTKFSSHEQLRTNDKWPNGICVTDLAIGARRKRSGRVCRTSALCDFTGTIFVQCENPVLSHRIRKPTQRLLTKLEFDT